MFLLLRRGFAFDLALFLILAVLTGAGGAAAAALAIDAAFGDAVSHLMGQAGETDLIVHLREDAAEGSLPVLTQLLQGRWPGVQVRRSVRVAGNDNILVTFPPEHRRADVFQSLPSFLSEITGYNGHTWVVEPSLTISGVRPAVAERLLPELAAIPGVAFPFHHGSRVTAVLDHPGSLEPVAEAIEAILARYQVAEIRLPQQADPQAVWEALRASLPPQEQDRWVDITGGGAAAAGPEALLLELAQLLDLYAPRAYLNPSAGLSVGDRVVVAGVDGAPLQPGDALPGDTLPGPGSTPAANGGGPTIVEVTVAGEGRVQGRIVAGAAGQLAEVAPGRFAGPGFLLEGRRVGAPVGTVTVESPRHALEAAAAQAQDTVERVGELAARMESVASATLDALSRWVGAMLEVEEVQQQLNGVQALLNGGGDGGPASRQALATLLLGFLARDGQLPLGDLLAHLGAQADGAAPAAGAGEPGSQGAGNPLQEVKAEVEQLRQQLASLTGGELDMLAETVARLEAGLPGLPDAALADTLRRLDAYTGQRGWGPTLEVLVPAGMDADTIARRVQEAASVSPLVATFEAGLLNPNPRASLLQVLVQVRHTLAGTIAIGLAAFVLWADAGTLLQAGRLLQSLPGSGTGWLARRRGAGKAAGKGRRWAEGALHLAWGALLGLALVGGMYALAGGAVPGLTLPYLALLAAALGMLVAALAERIAPVKEDEVVAAAANGLTPADIMREVVIPEGRPGFLQLVARLRGKMR